MVAFSKRVLVVDDEPIVCDSYQRVLREEGYNVSVATTGRDALEQCRSSPVDVMLLDLKCRTLMAWKSPGSSSSNSRTSRW
ncbi:MAG: response regulator [Planctomycetes bacterium]|nr:response regulator [Planctomycetota bacterium]